VKQRVLDQDVAVREERRLVGEVRRDVALRLDLSLADAADTADNGDISSGDQKRALDGAVHRDVLRSANFETVPDDPLHHDRSGKVDVPRAVVDVAVHFKNRKHLEPSVDLRKMPLDGGEQRKPVLRDDRPGPGRKGLVLAVLGSENAAPDGMPLHALRRRRLRCKHVPGMHQVDDAQIFKIHIAIFVLDRPPAPSGSDDDLHGRIRPVNCGRSAGDLDILVEELFGAQLRQRAFVDPVHRAVPVKLLLQRIGRRHGAAERWGRNKKRDRHGVLRHGDLHLRVDGNERGGDEHPAVLSIEELPESIFISFSHTALLQGGLDVRRKGNGIAPTGEPDAPSFELQEDVSLPDRRRPSACGGGLHIAVRRHAHTHLPFLYAARGTAENTVFLSMIHQFHRKRQRTRTLNGGTLHRRLYTSVLSLTNLCANYRSR